MRVLIAEDERKLGKFVKAGLSESGFDVDWVQNGDEALDRLMNREYDAAVLDIMMPGRDGLSILRQLRKAGNSMPVLLATARTALDERIEGLNLGADDYISKPYYVEELAARLSAAVRRGASGVATSFLSVGDVRLDLVRHEAIIGGAAVPLTAREFSLLEYMMRSPGRVLTRTQILEHVWGYDFDPETNVVDVAIRRIRKKFNDAGGEIGIVSVRGVGYSYKEGARA
ncbi:MAG: response regulator transcription factor [Kiritimatiellae bacterium]|nr:response regulator transcription factor [Kiritimatiellia bacterium]